MARFQAGARATGAGTALLPLGSLYAGATGGGRIREIGIVNTTAVAVTVGLCRLTTAGTATGIAEEKHDPNSPPAVCAAVNSHSAAGPTLTDLPYRFTLGAAVGAAIVWTFADSGLVIPVGAANGIGIYVPVGTGQICDFYFTWDE